VVNLLITCSQATLPNSKPELIALCSLISWVIFVLSVFRYQLSAFRLIFVPCVIFCISCYVSHTVVCTDNIIENTAKIKMNCHCVIETSQNLPRYPRPLKPKAITDCTTAYFLFNYELQITIYFQNESESDQRCYKLS